VCALEYYSAIKKIEMMAFAGKWVELEMSMLSEISQAPRTKHHVIAHL
jgi:hypothetical protein